jgi:hypothetical protein
MNVYVKMKKPYLISIENLHLIAGFSLVVSGLLVYQIDGIEMALSWLIFGAMYISMSDIGEAEMTEEKQNSLKHIVRRLFGYAGAIFSLVLVFYYLTQLMV